MTKKRYCFDQIYRLVNIVANYELINRYSNNTLDNKENYELELRDALIGIDYYMVKSLLRACLLDTRYLKVLLECKIDMSEYLNKRFPNYHHLDGFHISKIIMFFKCGLRYMPEFMEKAINEIDLEKIKQIIQFRRPEGRIIDYVHDFRYAPIQKQRIANEIRELLPKDTYISRCLHRYRERRSLHSRMYSRVLDSVDFPSELTALDLLNCVQFKCAPAAQILIRIHGLQGCRIVQKAKDLAFSNEIMDIYSDLSEELSPDEQRKAVLVIRDSFTKIKEPFYGLY